MYEPMVESVITSHKCNPNTDLNQAMLDLFICRENGAKQKSLIFYVIQVNYNV